MCKRVSECARACMQSEVLQESINMVPDCERRLATARTDLTTLMVGSHVNSLICTINSLFQ